MTVDLPTASFALLSMFHTILPKTPQYFNEQSTNNQATENERRSRVERIFRIHSFQKQVLELRKHNIQPVIRKCRKV